MFVKDRALGRSYIDKYVASELVTMHDGSAVQQAATMFFDDEGTLTGDTVIIDKGVLKTGMCDALSAARLGVKPTGNGRRESYERKAYARMTNTYFDAGLHRLRLFAGTAQLRHGGPQKLGHPVHGVRGQGNQGRQAHREDFLPHCAHRLCAGFAQICQHDGPGADAVRLGLLRQGL